MIDHSKCTDCNRPMDIYYGNRPSRCAGCTELASLRAQLAEANARAESACHERDLFECALNDMTAERDAAIARAERERLVAELKSQLLENNWREAESERVAAIAHAERAERERRDYDEPCRKLEAALDEARAQLAAVHQELLDERKRSMSSTDYERGFDDGFICGVEKTRERAKQAESRVLSDETVAVVRRWASIVADRHYWFDGDAKALVELDAKYPACPDGCGGGA